MSIKIEIDAHPDRGDMREQIEQAMSALGFIYEGRTVIKETIYSNELEPRDSPDDEVQTVHEDDATEETPLTDDVDYPGQPEQHPVIEEAQPQRERGKPAPGRKRRTKEEIAEDEAADAAEADALEDSKAAATFADAEDMAAISTGENRVGPEDEPEDAEADAADEAAEAAASKADGPTLDDIRIAVSRYTAKYGNVATFSDMTKIVGGPIVDVKPEDIEAVVKKIDKAVATDPYDRGGMPDETPAEPAAVEDDTPHATKDDVIEAMKKYLVIADGPNANPADLSTMPNATEDFAKLFTMIFGAGITKLGHIPPKPENYGKVLAGINEMITKDPFGRKS